MGRELGTSCCIIWHSLVQILITLGHVLSKHTSKLQNKGPKKAPIQVKAKAEKEVAEAVAARASDEASASLCDFVIQLVLVLPFLNPLF